MTSAELRAALRRTFGYEDFRPGQEALIRAATSGEDALGVLPTGGGKSICYQLPSVLLPGLVLIVSPLISLMEDQVLRGREVGIHSAFLNSTLGRSEAQSVLEDAVAGRLDLLFLAPERFHVPAFRSAMPSLPISLLAVDEAHCIAHWGHDFRPEYGMLGAVREELSVPVLAVTATATPRVREEIVESLRLRNPTRVVLSFDRPNLSWCVSPAGRHGSRVRKLHRLLRARDGGAAVIYAATRRAVEAVRRDLARLGHPIRGYHAGLSGEDRSAIQEGFVAGDLPVIVATNAFGMGIDKADVRLVAHYQLPGSLEGYYQEAGRAGRDGRPADCVALYNRDDLRIHRRFARTTHPPRRRLRRVHRHLRRCLGEGRRGTVRLEGVADALGRSAGPREAVAALRALDRAGAVRLYHCPEAHDATSPGEAGDSSGARDSQRPPDGGTIEAELGLYRGPLVEGIEARLRRRALTRLRAVSHFAGARSCRRRTLLEYFGEKEAPATCGRCDRCAPHLFSPAALR